MVTCSLVFLLHGEGGYCLATLQNARLRSGLLTMFNFHSIGVF